LALLGHAEEDLNPSTQAVFGHDVRRHDGGADAELLCLCAHERALDWTKTPASTAAVDHPLGLVQDLRAQKLGGAAGASWHGRHVSSVDLPKQPLGSEGDCDELRYTTLS